MPLERSRLRLLLGGDAPDELQEAAGAIGIVMVRGVSGDRERLRSLLRERLAA